MARVKLSPLLTDISGSIGGMTIQRNKFGRTLRSKPLPLNSSTIAQYNIRQKIVIIQSAWQNLTDAQRLQWNRFLDFSGQTIKRDNSVKLSGHALYIKYQLMPLLYDLPLLTSLSYIPLPAVRYLTDIKENSGTYYIAFNGVVDKDNYFFTCKLSSPRLENQAFSKRGLRFMQVPYQLSSSFIINDPYIASFGALPPVTSFIHYELQWFSIKAPILSGFTTGSLPITVIP